MEVKTGPRERILTSANKLFYTQGYNLTGINQIIEDAQVAKASLYSHFKSKEELGIEYIKSVRINWFTAFNTFLNKSVSPEQKILAAFDFLESSLKANAYRGCRFINLLSEIDTTSIGMQTQIIEHKTKLKEYFNSLLLDYMDGQTSTTLPYANELIYMLFEAAIIESKIYQNEWPINSAKSNISNILHLLKSN